MDIRYRIMKCFIGILLDFCRYICMYKKIFGIRIWRNVLEVLRYVRIWRFCCIYGGVFEGFVGYCGWRGLVLAFLCMFFRF